MKNIIEQFNLFSAELWKNLMDDLITDEEYFNQEREWILKNGSDELFDYLLDKYEGTKSYNKFLKYKKEFKKI